MTWVLTKKRRENLVKFCLSAFTVDLTGLVVPFLQGRQVSVILLAVGMTVAVLLMIFAYLLDR